MCKIFHNIKKKIILLDEKLFPFSQFDNCNTSNPIVLKKAYLNNKSKRHILIPYINNWIQFTILMLLSLWIPELLGASNPNKSYFQAVIAVSFTLSFIASFILIVSLFYLTFVDD